MRPDRASLGPNHVDGSETPTTLGQITICVNRCIAKVNFCEKLTIKSEARDARSDGLRGNLN